MSVTREEFEANSARLNTCPLCGDHDVQLNTHPEYKPDANCNNCGISYQGETIDETVQHWNNTLPEMRRARSELDSEEQNVLLGQK